MSFFYYPTKLFFVPPKHIHFIKLIWIVLFIFWVPLLSFGTDFYFSTTNGDDSRSITEAQNPETPWKTIDKLNAISSALKGGDRVLFAAGDVFYGTINVVKGGEVGNPIVYTSYGLGPAPQITSLETITEWRSLGGGLYEASLPNLESSVIQILEIDNIPQEIGRTPNSYSESPFFEIQNVLGTNSISGEGSFGDLTGAEVVIRKNNWIIDRHPISSSSGNTINFESINTAYNVKSGYGYFVQNHVSTLDSFGEWAYNPTLKTITVFLGAKKPSTFKIKVANKDNLVTNNRYIQNITFSNLHFKGSNKSIFSLKNSGNFTINKNIIESAGDNAIYVEEVPDLTISNNTIKNNLNGGLFVYYGSPRIKVTNNLFENSMPYQGMGKSSDLTGIALYIASDSDNSLIEKNQIINTSYNGIHFGGDYTIVKNNYIEKFCVFKQDGGGIYTNADGQTNRNNTGREIVGNIILNGLGNIDGNEEKLYLANGIYLDDMAAGLKLYKNTISNINGNGIFLHNNNNVEVSDNLFYKIPTQILASHDPIGTPIRDIIVKENQLSRIYDNELVMDFNSIDYDVAQFGQVDNNYFLDPYHKNFFFYSREPSDGQIGQTRNLKNWGDAFGYDLNSKQPRFNLDRYEILTQDPIKSSTFDANIDFVAGTYGGTGQWIPDGIEGGSLSLQPNPGGDLLSYLQIGSVEVGDQILLEFDSKSVEDNKEVILFLEKTFDQDQVGSLRFFATTTDSERIQIGFTAEVAAANESIVIKIPDPSEPVIFDNIEISKVTTRELNILEYVYFNYNNSDEEVTFPLSGIYRNAKNEFFFQKVTIPPYESVLLVRLELDLPDLPESAIEIAITEPAPNTELYNGDNIVIKTQITDPDEVLSKVYFYQGDSLLTRIYQPPFDHTWPDPAPGQYNLKAVAYDILGRTSESEIVPVIVLEETLQNQPPSVEILTPSNNQSIDFGQDVLISTFPQDPDGTVDRVEIYEGNNLLGTANSSPYEVTWSPPSINAYSLYAKVYDTEGAEGQSEAITVNITEPPSANLPPLVEIIDPSDDQYLIFGQDILIQTDSYDPENAIQKVEFYSGTDIIGTSETAPFSFNWTNAEAKDHALKSIIYDEQGANSESSIVNLHVIDTAAVDFPPIVSLQQPIKETVFNSGALIEIAAEIQDPQNNLERVEIYSNGNLVGTIFANPFELDWTADVEPGTYLLYAIAYDNNGDSKQSKSIIIHIVPPIEGNLPPTITISQPITGDDYHYAQKILVKTNPYDPENDLKKVDIYIDGELVKVLGGEPFEYEWTKIPIGSHQLYAVATDNDGQSATSEVVEITVSNHAPSITINNPLDGQTFTKGEDVLIQTTPIDPENEIDHVEFFYNEQIFGIAFEAPYEFNWETPPPGTYTLKTKVFDVYGLTAESSRPVITVLDNQPPSITIEEPVDGQKFSLGDDILIKTNPIDPEGDIDHVEFFYNEQIFGIAFEAPYEFNWVSPPAGTYTLKVKVFDGEGLTAESSRPVITVQDNQPPTITIEEPVDGQTFSLGEDILIRTNPIDPEGDIDHVEFFYNEQIFAIVTEAPYEYNWVSPPAGTYTLKTKVFDGGGLTAESSRPVIEVVENPFTPFNLYINAGSNQNVEYEAKQFLGDASLPNGYFDQNKTYFNAEANTQLIYQSARGSSGNGGTLTYEIPLENGVYKVSTYHIELHHSYKNTGGPGRRVFDIIIEGNIVKDDLDLLNEVGNEPLKLEFENIFVSDGALTISMPASIDRPIISGISIERQSDSNQFPESNFSYYPDGFINTDTFIEFNGELSIDEDPLKYQWDFGDGSKSNEIKPIHKYQLSGKYTVSLIVTDIIGQSDFLSKEIIVEEAIAPENFKLSLNTGTNQSSEFEGIEFLGDELSTDKYYDQDKSYTNILANTIPLYQTARGSENYGETLTYNIPIPNGSYNVSTYHIELHHGYKNTGGPGRRVFDIIIEGDLKKDNLDILAEAGKDPIKLEFNAITVSDGLLTISMPASIDRPIISGIFIEGVSNNSLNRTYSKPTILASPLEGKAPLEVNFIGDLTGLDYGDLTYTYEFEEGEVSSEKNPSHIFNSVGTHEVMVTVRGKNGIISKENISIKVSEDLDPSTRNPTIKVYPNPASDIVSVESADGIMNIEEINIYDIRGRFIQSYPAVENENKNNYSISVKNLAAGVYLLTTTSNEGVVQFKRLIVVK